MITLKKTSLEDYGVVHPLFDEPEVKLSPEGLGRIKMSRSVRLSLMALRGYLLLMFVLLAYHVAQMAGFFGGHIVR